MKTLRSNSNSTRAFTLIELLVVIAVIAILAGLLLPAGSRIMQNAAKRRAQAELNLAAAAIDSYKGKLGYYPPDNPNNPALNQLYYELVGCERMAPFTYRTLDKESTVTSAQLGGLGIANASAPGSGGDEGPAAQKFIKEVPGTSYATDAGSARRLGVAIDGPFMVGKISPFRYNSSNPTNNPNSYDLWVDITVGGKTYRVSNWRDKPQQL